MSTDDTTQERTGENIPQAIGTLVQQWSTRPQDDNLTSNIEQTQTISSTLENVEQWSDLLRSAPQLASNISHLIPTADEYQDEQHLAVGSPRIISKTTTVTQAEVASDVPLLDETSIALNQGRVSEIPQPYEYRAPTNAQSGMGFILTTASALSSEEPAQETTANITQLYQAIAKNLTTLHGPAQQASSVTQASASFESSIFGESAFNVDQRIRPDAPQNIQYKAPADIQPSIGSIRTTASALSNEDEAQETPINIIQLRQPTTKDSSTSDVVEQQAISITQPSAFTDMPIFEETSLSIDQIHLPDTPQTVHYKAPAGIQPSAGSIHTTTFALSTEEPAEETPVHITQMRQRTATDSSISDVTEQQTSLVTQPSIATDIPILEDTFVHLDQVVRPGTPQTVQYKAPADIQPSAGSIRTTASTLSEEELAQETPINVNQLRQPTAKDLPASDVTQQQATSVTQLSAATDASIFQETSLNADRVIHPDAPEHIQYKAPADIQPSTGSILTTTSVRSEEEPAQETPVNINQLRQPAAKDLPTSDVTEQQATSVTQFSATTDASIFQETSLNADRVIHPDAPEHIQYKAPADIQPSTGSILTTTSVLSEEEPAQETPVNVNQLRQPTAKDLPTSDVTEQQATSVTQFSATTDASIFQETSLNADRVIHPDAPEHIQYKAPADIQPSTSSILTTTSVRSEEEPAQETPVNVNQLRQPAAKDLPTTDVTKQQATSVTQLSAATDAPILEETSLNVDRVIHPDVPEHIQYKAPADIQPSTGSILTTTSVLSEEEPAQETPVNVNQLRQPAAKDLPTFDVTQQQATSVTQLSAATDASIFQETSLNADRVIHPDAPEHIQYKAPADIQPSTGSIRTTTSVRSEEEPAQETPVNINQLRQPTATDLPTSDITEQQATSVTQLSAATEAPIFEETSLSADRVIHPDAPEHIQYKAPADIQPSTGSILTTTSVLSDEEPAQETPVNINQLRQPAAKDLPTSDVTEQQATSVTQLSAATDIPILEETSLNVDQVIHPDAPQTIQYKAPADIQPSTGSILTTASALSAEEPAQETSMSVSQLRQPAATESQDETRQRASSVSQPSVAVDASLIEETAMNVKQVQLAPTSHPYEYKAPPDIKEVSANLRSTPSVFASEDDQDEFMSTTIQAFQQQKGHKAQRPSVIADLSFAPAEDDFSEMPHEVQVQQQRLLKMPQKLVTTDEEIETTEDSQFTTDLKNLEEEEKSISRESSMNVDEVIETIRLEDEVTPLSDTAAIEVLPTIEELPQTTSEEIAVQMNQLEIVSSNQLVEELPPVVNAEVQSLLKQLDHVSSIQPAPLDIPTAEELESFVTIDKESPTLKLQYTEEPFEILTSEIVDYVDISPTMMISDEPIPEAIIVTDETKSTKTTKQREGT